MQALPMADGKYVGMFFAKVHQHVLEPDGSGVGKIRVVCPVLYQNNVSPECFPATGIGGGGYTDPNGTVHPNGLFAVPPVGSTVLIGLSGGDPDFPIYHGGWWGSPNGQSQVPASPHQAAAQGSPDAVVMQFGNWRILLENGAVPILRLELVGNEDTAISIDGSSEEVVLKSAPSGGQEAVITIDGASGTITIDGDTAINLGVSSLNALVKGTAFKTFFDAHIHNDPVSGVTSPPTVAMDTPPGTHLSQKVNAE